MAPTDWSIAVVLLIGVLTVGTLLASVIVAGIILCGYVGWTIILGAIDLGKHFKDDFS